MVFNFDDIGGGMSAAMLGYTDPDALLFAGGGEAWEAALLESGLLTTQRTVLVDLFLVAGGMTGGAGTGDGSYGYGGTGGQGGNWRLVRSFWLRRGVSYTVTVGGSDSATTISGSDGSVYSTEDGVAGSPGGQGAQTGNLSRARSAAAGSPGVYAYNETADGSLLYPSRRFCPGGGGADTRHTGSYTWSNSSEHGGSNAGGDTGGGTGAGGIGSIGAATAGASNTGAGGGAGSKDERGTVLAAPAPGGSGIVMFRPHKEVAA